MYDKLLALAVLFLACAAGGGCAMCDANYPYGPTAAPHGYHGRAGSVLEPTPYAAMPNVAPGQPVDAGAMQGDAMEAESMEADAMEAESMPIE